MASILSFFSERSTGSNNMKKNREPSCETMESLHESATPSRLPLLDMDLMNHKARKKLNLIPLIFLIYFEVSGGPYGEEPVVRAAGPLLGIIGFVVFPFIWSIPEVLITAELSTTFPGNGGYVLWVNKAFGSFPASIMGSWKYLSGVINNAAYPVLCANYLKHAFPSFASGFERNITIAGFNLILSLLNYTGLTIVGYVAVTLGILSLLPFIIMGFISIPKIHPRRWVSLGEKGVKKDWSLYFNTLFWNLNFWDNVSALAGEVDQPQKTFPTALFFSIILACFGYLIPLLAGTGALPLTQDAWSDGFLAQVAGMIGGEWLKIWVEFGSVLSAIGLFQAQLSTCSYQLLGMAENGFLPHFFAFRSTWFDTPWVGILLSTVITLSISFMEFTDIISSANFLYCLSMLLEFSAFIYLRKKYPSVKRPYRIPMEIPGLVFMCVTPSAFLIYVMTVGTKIVYVLGCSLTVFGIALYFVVCFCKSRRLFKFIKLLEEEEENEE